MRKYFTLLVLYNTQTQGNGKPLSQQIKYQ